MDRKIAIALIFIIIVIALSFIGDKANIASRGSLGSTPPNAKGINISEKDFPQLPAFNASNITFPNITMPGITLPNSTAAVKSLENITLPFGAARQSFGNVSSADIKFNSVDGAEIYGTIYLPNTAKAKGTIVALHQLGADRRSMEPLALKLAQKGWAVFAIDMRGSGQSKFKDGYSTMSASDFLLVKKDLAWADDVVADRAGISGAHTSRMVGASIGANLALQYAAENPSKINSMALLSPGLDFRGVETESAASAYRGKALIISSSEDSYSAASAATLAGYNQNFELVTYTGLGHGTEMLRNSGAMEKTVEYLDAG